MIENSMVVGSTIEYEYRFSELTQEEIDAKKELIRVISASLLIDEPVIEKGKTYRFDNVLDYLIDENKFHDAMHQILTVAPDSALAKLLRECATKCATDIVED